jgi:hypothetical protein
MATSGIVAGIYVPTSASSAMTDEATTANVARTRYQVTTSARRVIDPAATTVVKEDGTTLSSALYTIEYVSGTIVFAAARGAGVAITVTSRYWALAEAGGLKSFKVSAGAALLDSTDFAGDGWRTFVAGPRDWSVTADGYWLTDAWFNRLGSVVYVYFFLDKGTSKRRLEGLVFTSGDDVSGDAGELIAESLKFDGSGPLVYREA